MQFVEDTTRGMIHDLDGQTTAVVAFGGINMRMGGMPVFEFFGLLDGMPAGRVLVRDLDQSWYQHGVRGVGDNIADAARALKTLLTAHDVERVACVGCSAGGFAAILFGSLIGADVVHAFGAQTTIARKDLRRIGDRRWDAYLKPLWKHGGAGTMFDVRAVLADVAVFAHWGTAEPLDEMHACRLDGHRGVTLVPHEGLGHANLTRSLRATGMLGELLAGALEV